jgi:hypothetical protein
MANQKLQVARAINVYPSDNSDIPFPNISVSGQSSGSLLMDNTLIVDSPTFTNDNVAAGDIVYNITQGTTAMVTSLLNDSEVELNANIFTVESQDYIIYKGGNNSGCVIYVGQAGDVDVTTAGGDRVTFVGLLTGQFVPVQVVKVWSANTNASNLLALW